MQRLFNLSLGLQQKPLCEGDEKVGFLLAVHAGDAGPAISHILQHLLHLLIDAGPFFSYFVEDEGEVVVALVKAKNIFAIVIVGKVDAEQQIDC